MTDSSTAVRTALCRIASATVLVLLASACAMLPRDVERPVSHALADTAGTRLGRAVSADVATHAGTSGIFALPDPRDAFATRALLTLAAERSLDLQYYIWHDDTTGRLLFYYVWGAAERGVRVRILLDDANTKGLDETIAALDAHPNIEVRLFNPLPNRNLRAADYIFDLGRVNHRMHNKSFSADNQVAVVGGRNVGDEYFGAGDDIGFVDLDVMGVGPVVRDVSREFDLFWNSRYAYPAASVLPAIGADAVARKVAQWTAAREAPDAVRYRDALRNTPIIAKLQAGTLEFEWTTAQVVHDDPQKVDNVDDSDLLVARVDALMREPMREFDLVSPYFIPGPQGTQRLASMTARGVDVRILTNSWAATDVAPVHAVYSKYRHDLLEAGVHLYELRREGTEDRDDASSRPSGASAATGLHAKTFAVDRRQVFVGSFNFDQRSKRINTEMGIVIDSPALATRLAQMFDERVPQRAYELRLTADREGIEWIERGASGETRYAVEPDSSAPRRLWYRFLSVLPIEWLL